MIDRTMNASTVTSLDGRGWPPIGLGTWRMGEVPARRKAEVGAVRAAIEIGYRLIDTAEMYGDGGAESVVGEALRDVIAAGTVRREELVVVSKVYPHHGSRDDVIAACRRSLDRLGLEQLDAYLLHWRGAVPLRDTVAGFEALCSRGSIRGWGVSNFDVADLEELFAVDGGSGCVVNQIYYSLGARGPAFDLLPWHARHGITTMAYSPLDQGALSRHGAVQAVAARQGCDPAQVAIAWLVRQDGVVPIPKSVSVERLRANLAAADAVTLDTVDLATLDAAFAPPSRKQPLAMI